MLDLQLVLHALLDMLMYLIKLHHFVIERSLTAAFEHVVEEELDTLKARWLYLIQFSVVMLLLILIGLRPRTVYINRLQERCHLLRLGLLRAHLKHLNHDLHLEKVARQW